MNYDDEIRSLLNHYALRILMHLTGYKKLIVALLLLVFTSQSIAALAMSCQLNSLVQPMMGMDHSMMAMDDSMDMMDGHSMPSGDQTADCCKVMGHCPMGNCFPSATSTSTVSFSTFTSTALDSYRSTQPDPLISSLYRPPIFR